MHAMRHRTTAKSAQTGFLVSLLVATGLVACNSDHGVPDCSTTDPPSCAILRRPEMDGVWKLTHFRASGVWSKGAEKTAASFLGKHVTIDNLDVTLPDGTKCRIVSAGKTLLSDGVESFGSAAGSWRRMGFTPRPDGLYEAEEIRFNCDGMFWGITMQPEHDLHLLKVWEVFLVMKKTEP